MTPAELNKSLTVILDEMLKDTGFSKKRISRLYRKTGECNQFLSFYFSRDRGFPGNLYTLTITMSFSFVKVNKLTSEFLGEEYRAEFGTGAQPLYTVIPNGSSLKYTYCSENSLKDFAEIISGDFHSYALNFYDKYDTLNKLETYFYYNPKSNPDGFRFVSSGRSGGYVCCYAAVLCALEEWDKCRLIVREDNTLSDVQKDRIIKYIADR